MPRKNPLPPAEVAIGRRLLQARKEALIPRAALAVKLGISTDRLFSYETGRARLPWGIAERASKVLDIHPSILAGAQHFGLYGKFDLSVISAEDREKAPFSDIYDRVFAPTAADCSARARDEVCAGLISAAVAIENAIRHKVPMAAADLAEVCDRTRDVQQLAKKISLKRQS